MFIATLKPICYAMVTIRASFYSCVTVEENFQLLFWNIAAIKPLMAEPIVLLQNVSRCHYMNLLP
ncbi:hypothetical protein J26TS2_13860 [Shouchella clausii]|nr:hypothetical protein J26TS2_13860 [Shouchella clausii]